LGSGSGAPEEAGNILHSGNISESSSTPGPIDRCGIGPSGSDVLEKVRRRGKRRERRNGGERAGGRDESEERGRKGREKKKNLVFCFVVRVLARINRQEDDLVA
jgi:hypothetical protein